MAPRIFERREIIEELEKTTLALSATANVVEGYFQGLEEEEKELYFSMQSRGKRG